MVSGEEIKKEREREIIWVWGFVLFLFLNSGLIFPKEFLNGIPVYKMV